ncbi:MAG: DUF4160 domain-containing protein [Gammaproteobacteria bacterium]|nr:DUF4160 domain-containing protein [Gammaproteobacteria bacterium]
MPEISRFFGIIIAIYFKDHNPPHFHAKYGEFEAQISIDDGAVLAGNLPRRALNLVDEWRRQHASELLEDWRRAAERKPLLKIEPLE